MLCRQLLIFTALLAAVSATSTDRCHVVVSNTCLQHCNNRSCDCGVTDGNHAYTNCDQACTDAKCMAITCSSETCYQKCHNCHMECTSDVGFCRQRCLSGACSFKCNARHCEQECDGENCYNTVPDNCQIIVPRFYLVLLAGFLLAIIVLSCLLLVHPFSNTDCCPSMRVSRGARYSKLRNFSDSVESVNSL